jgi:phosphate/phosphite/phosphonate ABC transporter binding protein
MWPNTRRLKNGNGLQRKSPPFRSCLLALVAGAVVLQWGCDNVAPRPDSRETITIAGSASPGPIVKALVQAYLQEHPHDKIQFLPDVHSAGGILGVADGTLDMGVVSRALTREEDRYGLLRYPFALDMVVFATHPRVQVVELSTREVVDIYSGRISNWKELGGPDQPIVVLDRPEHSSAKQALRQSLLGENFSCRPDALVLERVNQMDDALKTIAGSIGYTSYSNLVAREFDIPLLRLDGTLPIVWELERSRSKTYRQYAFVIKGRPAHLVKRFLDFVNGRTAQEIIRSKGLVPDRRKVTIAFAPEINIIEQETRYIPLFNYLYQKTGTFIDMKYSASYSHLIRDLVAKRLDGALLGSFAYSLINEQAPLEVLARPVINGQSFYTGILFVRKDSGIKTLEDLRGKTFSFVDQATTAGYLFPMLYFKQHGVTAPEDFFGKTLLSGSHDASIMAVLNGKADAGSAKDLVLMRVGEKDVRVALDLVMLATSLPVPTNGLCVNQSLDWDLKEDLQQVLLAMEDDTEGRQVLKRVGAERFLPTTHRDYQNLYVMLKELGIDLATYLSGPKGAL